MDIPQIALMKAVKQALQTESHSLVRIQFYRLWLPPLPPQVTILSPYYNWELTSMTSITKPNFSVPPFTISTVYSLVNLWLMKNWILREPDKAVESSISISKGTKNDPEQHLLWDSNVGNEEFPENYWLILANITQHIYQGNLVLTLFFISILAYWIKCIIGYIAGTLKISLI